MKKENKIILGILSIIFFVFLFFLNKGEDVSKDTLINQNMAEIERIKEEERKQKENPINYTETDTLELFGLEGFMGTVIIFGIIISVVVTAFSFRRGIGGF